MGNAVEIIGTRDYFAANAPPVPDWFDCEWAGGEIGMVGWSRFRDGRIENYLIGLLFQNDVYELPLNQLPKIFTHSATGTFLNLLQECRASRAVSNRAYATVFRINKRRLSMIESRKRHAIHRTAAWSFAYADAMLAAREPQELPDESRAKVDGAAAG